MNIRMIPKRLCKNIIRHFLISKNKPSTILLGKNKYSKMYGIDLQHVFSMTERHLQKIIDKYIKNGDNVIDVGANVGFFTIYFSRKVGDNGKVYAFEPIITTYDKLTSNISLNKITNVDTYNMAASDKIGKTSFRMPIGNHSMASMHWHRDCAEVYECIVDSVNLDSIFLDGKIDFIKIDVEGAEGEVVSGMKNLIFKNKPIVFVECSDIGRLKFWEVMKEFGYKCYYATDDNVEVDLFQNYRHGDYLWIYCVKNY